MRHVLGISGGKDSAALAIYMRDKVPEMEYFFCDTDKELPETYAFLERLKALLGIEITKLNATRGFDHWLDVYGGYLPSPNMRWCTRQLKLKPFEDWIGEDEVTSYVGIRADEKDRKGYLSTKPSVKTIFPFIEGDIDKAGVFRILEESGVKPPDYYRWRTRSGCYFCFFQRKSEWVRLADEHPDLFEQAKAYEKLDPATGQRYTWSQGESLDELLARRDTILAADIDMSAPKGTPTSLSGVLAAALEDADGEAGCTLCHI